MSTLLQRVSRTSTRHLRGWPFCIQPSRFGTQIASLVHVATIQRSNPKQSSAIRVEYQHPTAFQTGKNTYDIDVIFNEDDENADVCWTFQIAEEEDLLDRLSWYACSFGKHGSGDDDYDEYVRAFQSTITWSSIRRTLSKERRLSGNGGDDEPVDMKEVEKDISGHEGEKKEASTRFVQSEHDASPDVPHTKRAKVEREESVRWKPGIKKTKIGRLEDADIKLHLMQGQSYLEMESHLQRTKEYILQRALKFPKAELKALTRNKRGPWSDSELEALISLRQESRKTSEIALLLRRNIRNVRQRLDEVTQEICERDFHATQGPYGLPPVLAERFFTYRLFEILKGIEANEMTPTWRNYLSQRTTTDWLSIISNIFPAEVQQLLSGLDNPTFERLQALPWKSTRDAGVYGRLLEPECKPQLKSERLLYIGSATKHGAGLEGRMRQHTNKGPDQLPRLERRIKYLNLQKPGKFVTLMTMSMDSNSAIDDILETRRIAVLTEAIMTLWLGALEPELPICSLYPWDSASKNYTGMCSHNPLLYDICTPDTDTSVPDTSSRQYKGGSRRLLRGWA